MAAYVVLTRLTSAGAEGIRNNPQRIAEVTAQAARLGAKVVSQYSTLGPYDFVTIVEAPDNETIMRASAELSTLGTVKLQISPVIRMDRFEKLLKMQPYRT